MVRCVLPAVILFLRWRVNSSDHFALLWEPHKQNRTSCLEASMVLHKPHHVIDTVGGYPLMQYSDLEKWTPPFVLTNRADESLRGLWLTLLEIAASDLWCPYITPRLESPDPVSLFPHPSRIKRENSFTGIGSLWLCDMAAHHVCPSLCAGAQGRAGQEFFKESGKTKL